MRTHNEWIDDRRAKVLRGTKSFGLNTYDCSKYLNISNQTFHKPICFVEDIMGGHALVRATFLGSGIMSHPVKMAWVPLSVVQLSVEAPLWLLIIMKLMKKI